MRVARYWMTGCMALVLLAAARWVERDERGGADQAEARRISWYSPLPLDRAAMNIEREARALGLSVVANVVPTASGSGLSDTDGVRVLVLGDQDGHTPIMQADSDQAHPQLPWSILIRQRKDGGVDVSMANPDLTAASLDTPSHWTGQLQRLVELGQSWSQPVQVHPPQA